MDMANNATVIDPASLLSLTNSGSTLLVLSGNQMSNVLQAQATNPVVSNPQRSEICRETYSVSGGLAATSAKPVKKLEVEELKPPALPKQDHEMKQEQTENLPFVCDCCGWQCSKSSALRKHIRNKHEQRPYSCKYCDVAFKTMGNLTRHMKSQNHENRCLSLGMSQVPREVVEDEQVDREALRKQNELIRAGTIDIMEEDEKDEGAHVGASDLESERDESSSPPAPLRTVAYRSPRSIMNNLSKANRQVTSIMSEVRNIQVSQPPVTPVSGPDTLVSQSVTTTTLLPPNIHALDLAQDMPLNLTSDRSPASIPHRSSAPPAVPTAILNNIAVSEAVPGTSHASHDPTRLECPTCGQTFSRRDRLVLHMQVHAFTGDRAGNEDAPDPPPSSSCSSSSSSEPVLTTASLLLPPSSLPNFLPSVPAHDPPPPPPVTPPQASPQATGRPFKCSVCSTAFRVMGHLGKHFRSKSHLRALEKAGLLKGSLLSKIEALNIPLQDIIDQETGSLIPESLNRHLRSADRAASLVSPSSSPGSQQRVGQPRGIKMDSLQPAQLERMSPKQVTLDEEEVREREPPVLTPQVSVVGTPPKRRILMAEEMKLKEKNGL